MGEDENIENELKNSLVRFESELKTDASTFYTLKDILSIYDYYFFKGDNAKAVHALVIAKEQHPYSADPYIKDAELQIFFGNHKDAKALLEKAKIFEPTNEEILQLEVECLVLDKKIDEAIEKLYAGLEGSENRSEIFSYILEIAESNKKYDEAIVCLQQWLAMDNNSELLLFEISRLYIKQGRLDDGIDYFNGLINSDPYNSILWGELGGLYEEKEDFAKAIWAYEYSTLATDDFYSGHLNLANCYLHIEELGKMKEQLDLAKSLMPDSSELYLLYGRYYKEKSNYSTAKKYLLKSIDLNDNQPESWYEMGLTLKDLGGISDALPYFKTAYKLAPTDEDYALDYFYAEYEVFGVTAAIQVYENAKDEQDGNVEFYQQAALILCKEECFERAAEILQKDLDKKDLTPECLYLLAATYYELSNPNLGESYLIDALNSKFSAHTILFEAAPLLEFDSKIQETINLFRNE